MIEFLFRHLLGRTPATQSESQQYNKLLTEQGLSAAVAALIEGEEYVRFFGEDVVPYNRCPTLPAGNYLGSVKAVSDWVK